MVKDEPVQFKLMLPASLKNQLKREATGSRRSLSAEIVARLEGSLLVGRIPQADTQDAEMLDILNEIERLKLKIVRLRK